MRIRTWSAALIAVALTATSCSENGIVNPGKGSPGVVRLDALSSVAKVVISQIYGAGVNTNAVLQNDYVELFNAGTASQNLSGWSVQYAQQWADQRGTNGGVQRRDVGRSGRR